MNKKELLLKAKEYGIKGIYRMKKNELETAIYMHECASWFNSVAGNIIIIKDGEEHQIDISQINTDLAYDLQAIDDYKKWDIEDEEKINFLLKN